MNLREALKQPSIWLAGQLEQEGCQIIFSQGPMIILTVTPSDLQGYCYQP